MESRISLSESTLDEGSPPEGLRVLRVSELVEDGWGLDGYGGRRSTWCGRQGSRQGRRVLRQESIQVCCLRGEVQKRG